VKKKMVKTPHPQPNITLTNSHGMLKKKAADNNMNPGLGKLKLHFKDKSAKSRASTVIGERAPLSFGGGGCVAFGVMGLQIRGSQADAAEDSTFRNQQRQQGSRDHGSSFERTSSPTTQIEPVATASLAIGNPHPKVRVRSPLLFVIYIYIYIYACSLCVCGSFCFCFVL
jgi:hypothetical protein